MFSSLQIKGGESEEEEKVEKEKGREMMLVVWQEARAIMNDVLGFTHCHVCLIAVRWEGSG